MKKDTLNKFTRRRFILGALGLSGAGLLLQSANSSFNLDISEVQITDQLLPRKFKDYRIGFLSDIHLSRWFPPEHLELVVKAVNARDLDLVILGGDYLWVHDPILEHFFPSPLFPKIDTVSNADLGTFLISVAGDLLAPLRARDGVYAVLGNHDHWYLPPSKFTDFTAQGLALLVNKEALVRRDEQKLRLFGIDDYWTGAPKIPRTGVNKSDEYRIVATHNPDLFRSALQFPNFSFNLGLAGHTHGGQIKIPGLGAPFYNVEDLRFKSGLAIVGETSIYTTRGIGTVELPIRINCPPELTVITLSC